MVPTVEAGSYRLQTEPIGALPLLNHFGLEHLGPRCRPLPGPHRAMKPGPVANYQATQARSAGYST